MEILLIWVVMAIIVGMVAGSKGKSGGLWFLYGLLIWPIALTHALLISKQTASDFGPIVTTDHGYEIEGQVFKRRADAEAYAENVSRLKESPSKQPGRHCAKSAEKIWTGERDLGSDSYKLFLAEKYSIEKNDLFGKFVVADKMFSTLDAALDHADKQDRAQRQDS